MNLSLGSDGSATVTEDPGTGTKTLFGHWVDTGSQVMVTFDAEEGKPAEPAMAFQPAHDGLQAVTWDRAVVGQRESTAHEKGRVQGETDLLADPKPIDACSLTQSEPLSAG